MFLRLKGQKSAGKVRRLASLSARMDRRRKYAKNGI
jgi:hypothetical protein